MNLITHYSSLQFKRLQRWFEQNGINIYIGFVISTIGFVALSVYLFSKTEFAPYIYFLVSISFLLSLSDKYRNDQLKILFNRRGYILIRLTENMLLTLPFSVYLFFESEFMLGFTLIPIAAALAIWNKRRLFHKTIPTPFKRHPFEFIVGFRQWLWLVIAAYLIAFKAIQVGNFNLGLFTVGALFALSMVFYAKPEKSYFVWIYDATSARFLWKKLTTASLSVSFLTVPLSIILGVFFIDKWWLVLIIQGLGYLFLASMIFAKYSAFPKEIGVPQAILYGLCVWFPPTLLIIIPVFYIQSKRRLKLILE